MGGSSLCPEVLKQTFGTAPGHLKLHVLDTTDPGAIAAAAAKIALKKTLFIVASKSGGTIEVMSLFKHFWGRLEKAGVKAPGAQFVAITDPGTSLEKLAREKSFRKTFLSRADVGGRFSALTYFGLVPAALIGVERGKTAWTAPPGKPTPAGRKAKRTRGCPSAPGSAPPWKPAATR
jgi:glucose-6-phosphate isomerase